MTHDTNDIVDLVIVDKRQCQGKSARMEKDGLKKCLENLKGQLTIKELVTDAHSQIRSMMSEYYYPTCSYCYSLICKGYKGEFF